jgi:hypothetical protein
MCIPTHKLSSVARIYGIAKSIASKYRISASTFMLAGINIPYNLPNISPGFIFVHIRIFHGLAYTQVGLYTDDI